MNKNRFEKILSKDFLYKEYIINKKSSIQIAKQIGCNKATILNYLIKHSICRRLSGGSLKSIKAHNYQDGRTLKIHYCTDCLKKGIKTEINFNTALYGNCRCEQCYYKFNIGKNHPNYISNLIRDYPIKFNNILKESIRQRDNRQCQVCGKLEEDCYRKLDVHHIDYDKDNLNSENLISLCQSCHVSTNHNREIFIEFFGILKEILK